MWALWETACCAVFHGVHALFVGSSLVRGRTDLAERRMAAPLVIEHFDVMNNAIFVSPQLSKRSAVSLFTLEKKLSITALS